ncbi:MAG: DUF502 domain-containing protein [Burkholderiaceae bacterium]|nr:DUF502 domain-containing protein [Burkholderiaceae bacterium]
MRELPKIFVTGLLAALPLAATVLIVVWGARLVVGWVGPGSLIGNVLVSIGLGVTGYVVVAWAIGVLAVLLAILLLGVLVRTRLRGVFESALDRFVQRIPVVRNVYETARRFVELVSQRDGEGMRSMSPVWLHFGGEGGAAVLGLLSTTEPVEIAGRRYMAVLVPTAPVPVGGGLLYVPPEWVRPAELGVDGLTSIYVSMGITSAQHIGARAARDVAAGPVATGPVATGPAAADPSVTPSAVTPPAATPPAATPSAATPPAAKPPT